jgi:aryl carrier-like protein
MIDAPSLVPAPSPLTLDALRAMLVGQPAVRVSGLVNARTAADAWLARRVSDGGLGGSLAELAAGVPVIDAVHPDDLRSLHPDYVAFVEFGAHRADALDVTFVRRVGPTLPFVRRPTEEASAPLATWTNRPASRTTASALVPVLRDLCRSKLPDFMVPSSFVLLDAMPLTPNGKIDRKRLPAPESQRVTANPAPPATDLQRAVVGVFEELVGGSVGMDDNLFDAGMNSLLMVQASIRLRRLLGGPVPLVQMFQHPTARTLAAVLARSGADSSADHGEAITSRAGQRRDAMARRRATRAGG